MSPIVLSIKVTVVLGVFCGLIHHFARPREQGRMQVYLSNP